MAELVPETVVTLMTDYRQGSKEAAQQLVAMFYPELRRPAAVQMKAEWGNHTWQPTALVNELYLELRNVKSLRLISPDNDEEQAVFLRLAAFLMRRLLIHHARPLYRQAAHVPLEGEDASVLAAEHTVNDIDQLLDRLAGINPRVRQVTELKVFQGFTFDEIARQLQCSRRSAVRDWSFARHWLQRELTSPR